MSGNYTFRERLRSDRGIVREIKENEKGFYVVVEFDEDEPETADAQSADNK